MELAQISRGREVETRAGTVLVVEVPLGTVGEGLGAEGEGRVVEFVMVRVGLDLRYKLSMSRTSLVIRMNSVISSSRM
jgi:hypothetical protein